MSRKKDEQSIPSASLYRSRGACDPKVSDFVNALVVSRRHYQWQVQEIDLVSGISWKLRTILQRPADLVVDNRSNLVKVVAAPVVGQRAYDDAKPIYNVSITDVRQVGHVDWLRSSSANETSISKPSEYLFDRRHYLYQEFAVDRSRPMSPSFFRRLSTRKNIQ
ncbi:hypothetical protein ACH5RR_032439 [Cinchona calisaya]|uniref:Uncharacterized protein n=1 Tax=Cinchona calisaya TaxID=153742 RepID=A0ABD2YI31_9GENT